MVFVDHGGDAVESVPVNLELLHPVFDVGEEEALDLVFAVVEGSAVPQGVVALGVGVEVLVVGAIPHV